MADEQPKEEAKPTPDEDLPSFVRETKALLQDMLDYLLREGEPGTWPVDVIAGEKHFIFRVRPRGGKAPGVVLGRKGRTARAVRVFLGAAGAANGFVFHYEVDTDKLVHAGPAPAAPQGKT